MKRNRGVGLIEILITLLVISAGLLAYVSMQRSIYREATLSSGRAAATELALAKLEDLRSFTALYSSSGVFDFQDIGNNAGGTLSGGSLVQPSGTVTVDNIIFTRSWTAVDYWISGTNTAGSTTTPAGSPIPTYKLVEVVVSWTEQNAATQTTVATTTSKDVTLRSIIAGVDPRFTATIFR